MPTKHENGQGGEPQNPRDEQRVQISRRNAEDIRQIVRPEPVGAHSKSEIAEWEYDPTKHKVHSDESR